MRDLSLNIMDIAQNSICAHAKLIEIYVCEDKNDDTLSLHIIDDGVGMSDETLKKALDPFFTTRTTRKVGLGLSLLKMRAEMTGGIFSVKSSQNKGTVVKATFNISNIDMPAIGDIENTIFLLVVSNPEIDFVYTRERGKKRFIFDTREIKSVLGEDVYIDNIEVSEWIQENLKQLRDSITK